MRRRDAAGHNGSPAFAVQAVQGSDLEVHGLVPLRAVESDDADGETFWKRGLPLDGDADRPLRHEALVPGPGGAGF